LKIFKRIKDFYKRQLKEIPAEKMGDYNLLPHIFKRRENKNEDKNA